MDARQIIVNVTGGTAVLTGTEGTWLQREAAERAAEHAPGVGHVDNRILVEPPAIAADGEIL